MSNNFELMQEAVREIEHEISPAPAHRSDTLPRPWLIGKRDSGRLDVDRVAQEECLKLIQRLFLGKPTNIRRTIVFAGIDRGNGCSRICADAARVLAANTTRSICLVDGNFRSPSLHGFFGVPNHRGLADSLLEGGSIRSFVTQLASPCLWLLSAGALTPGSPNLLNSERFQLRLQELRKDFDYILVDAPALNLYTDAIALGRVADGVVVVLQADSTRRESALKGLENLRDAQIEVLGAVLNRRTFPIPGFVYKRL
jgi:succinoglycan biosynthesis transport protein ExoP